MAYFNPRYNLDEKIRFMFWIFDVNNDWKIDEEDLNLMIDLLFGTKFKGEEKTALIHRIISESDTG